MTRATSSPDAFAPPAALSAHERRARVLRAWGAVGLLAALALNAFLVLEPHATWGEEGDYWLPAHMDDWVHWGHSMAVIKDGTIAYGEIFTGGEPSADKTTALDQHERGFHAYVGTLWQVTGLPLRWIVVFSPLVMSSVTIVLAWSIAKRWDAGAEAAVLMALIPTTTRFLGPAFFVPIAWSIPLWLLGYHLLVHHDSMKSVLAFAVLALASWPIHGMLGTMLTLMAASYALVALRTRPARAAAIAILALLPFSFAWPYIVGSGARDDFIPNLTENEFVAGRWSWIFVLAALGLAALAWRTRRPAGSPGRAPDDAPESNRGANPKPATHLQRQQAALLAAPILIIGAVVILNRVSTDTDPYRLYDRTHMALFSFTALLGGAGLHALLFHALPHQLARLRDHLPRRNRKAPATTPPDNPPTSNADSHDAHSHHADPRHTHSHHADSSHTHSRDATPRHIDHAPAPPTPWQARMSANLRTAAPSIAAALTLALITLPIAQAAMDEPHRQIVTTDDYAAYQKLGDQTGTTALYDGVGAMTWTTATGGATTFFQTPGGDGQNPPDLHDYFSQNGQSLILVAQHNATWIITHRSLEGDAYTAIDGGAGVWRVEIRR